MLTGKILRDMLSRELKNLEASDKILLVNYEYPLNIRSGDAKKLSVALDAGTPSTAQVLETILDEVPAARAELMQPENDASEVYDEFSKILGDVPVRYVGRYDFFDNACDMPVRLAVASGDYRDFANILITLGGEAMSEEGDEEAVVDF